MDCKQIESGVVRLAHRDIGQGAAYAMGQMAEYLARAYQHIHRQTGVCPHCDGFSDTVQPCPVCGVGMEVK